MGQIDNKIRLAFLLFNILFLAMGISMIAVGIYNIISLLYFDVFARSVYLTGGVLFIIIGVVKMLIAILGIIGWIFKNRIVLGIYTLLGLFIILPTLAAGVFGLQQWYFVFSEVGVAMNDTFNNPDEFERTQTLRQQIRTDYFCCGTLNGRTDYTSRNGIVEPGIANCSRAMNFRASNSDIPQEIGCQYYVTSAIRHHLYYIGAIGLAFGFFELTAAIVGMQNTEGL